MSTSKAESKRDPSQPLIRDQKMRRIYELLEKLALTHIPILVLGETGVGKELIAEWVHRHSPRAAAPLVKLNCAGLTESVVESELFGHERGAFTGAITSHAGLFERADGGTLLLDEIGELPARTQAKLLRVLESGELQRVGGTYTRVVSVRVIAATHRDLAAMVERGEFRQDLFFRLNAAIVDVPPLRERSSEIAPLAELFLERYARRMERQPLELDRAAVSALLAYDWPGNVRELRNVIERAAAMTDGMRVDAAALALSARVRCKPHPAKEPRVAPGPMVGPLAVGDIRSQLREFERARIIAALETTMGNQTRAAKLLGVSRRTLTNKLTVHGLERPRRGLAGSPD
jgi:two-component system, NtrC family, response regulator AtoC